MTPPTVLQAGPLHSVHMRRWAENAADIGYAVHVAGNVADGVGAVRLEDVAEGVHVAPAAGFPLATITWVRWLRRLLGRIRPTLVHAHGPPTWGLYAALAGARPLVLSAWGSDVYLASAYVRALSRVPMRRADVVTAPSAHMIATLVERGTPQERCYEVDLGVDVDAFSPGPGGEEVRSEQGLGDAPVVFSFRGGFPAYNLPVVVEAFTRLRRRVPDARLVVALGGAAPSSETSRALERTEGVHVVGHVAHEDMPRYFRAATVGVSIPSSDGSPRSVWEAMACRVPLVLSDLPQIRERLGDSGAARLVEIDADAVAEALEEVITAPEAVARAGREWALANADRRLQLERLERAYLRAGAARPA